MWSENVLGTDFMVSCLRVRSEVSSHTTSWNAFLLAQRAGYLARRGSSPVGYGWDGREKSKEGGNSGMREGDERATLLAHTQQVHARNPCLR